MINILPSQGQAGIGIIDPSNTNFSDLYQVIGCKMQRFNSKVRSSNMYKDETVRISIWADSLWNSYLPVFKLLIQNQYQDKTFEWLDVQLGGTGSDYHTSMMWEVINWNPDLIICAENEGFGVQGELQENIFKLIKQKTSSDLAIVPWSITLTDMQLLANKDITGWKACNSYKIRQWSASMCSKYDAQLIDWNYNVIPDLYNGVVTPSELHIDEIHLSDDFYTNYATPIFQQHFVDLYEGAQLNHHKTDWFKSIRLANVNELPDVTEITKSGTWAINEVDTDKSYHVIQSSDVGAYLEQTINGIGFELAHFGDAIGQFGILIDGVAPSTLLKDYATPANNQLVGLYKVIVDTNILSNSEIEREFLITMTSATAYTLTDVTNSNLIGSGVITNDEIFTVTGGQLTIPANYASVTNWRGTIATAQTYTFSVKKNWYDTIDITADNLTQVTRIFGLERGEHTVRLTINSGTVNLDSIMELK